MSLSFRPKLHPTPQLFDRFLYQNWLRQQSFSPLYQKLCQFVSYHVIERLGYLRSGFSTAFLLGMVGEGTLANYLKTHKQTTLAIQTDLTKNTARSVDESLYVVYDDEHLPFADSSADLLIHFLGLHTVNDVPGLLSQSLRILKPDGFFLAVFIGNNSFHELRTVLETVEMETYGGISQRIFPWIRTREAGSLLQRAGFTFPVADCDKLTLIYPHLDQLLKDLKDTRTSFFLNNRRVLPLTKGFLAKAEKLYQNLFSTEGGEGLKVSLDLVYASGWRSAPRFTS